MIGLSVVRNKKNYIGKKGKRCGNFDFHPAYSFFSKSYMILSLITLCFTVAM